MKHVMKHSKDSRPRNMIKSPRDSFGEQVGSDQET